MTRWIAHSVDMLDHPVVGMDVPPPPAADKARHAQPPLVAWQDLLRSARWADGTVPHKGAAVALKRGEFLAGRAHWAKRWNWGEQAVRSFFSRLVENGMVAICNQSNGHLANVASICNYEKYQVARADAQPEQKPEPNQSPTRAQPEGNQNNTRNTLPKESAGARDESKTDQQVDALKVAHAQMKAVFNGQTEILIADAQRWMGHVPRENAMRWLSGTLAAVGELATLEAHKILVTDEAQGKIIGNPIAKWSKTAITLKSQGVVAKRPSGEVPHRISTETRLNVRPAGYGEVPNG